MTASRIVSQVWIGDIQDAALAHLSFGEPDQEFHRILDCRHILDPDPYFWKVDLDALDAVAKIIDKGVLEGEKILVHCAMGMERSVLAVVWWLHKYRGMTWDEAFKLVKTHRTIAIEHREWLDLSYEKARGDKR